MKVAILSDGMGWHLHNWARVVGRSADVEGVFLSDPSGHDVDAIRREVGDKLEGVCDSPAKLLEDNQVELAIIDTAPIKTPPAARAALEAGVHVIVEKPAATSPESYAELVDLAETKGLLLSMSLIEGPLASEAARIVSEGILGRIYGIHYMWMDYQRWRRRHTMDWVYSRDQAGGGMLGHEFCHAVHRIRRIVGQEVSEVTGFADIVSGEPLEVEDSVAMSVRFVNGAIGTLYGGSWGPSVEKTLPQSRQALLHNFDIWGEKGALHASIDENRLVSDLQHEEPLLPAENPPDAGDRTRQATILRTVTTITAEPQPEAFFQACLDAIRGHGPPPISNQDGLRFLEVQHAFYRASETGTLQHLKQA